MWQLSIPEEDAEATGIEIGCMHIGDAVDDAPDPPRVDVFPSRLLLGVEADLSFPE